MNFSALSTNCTTSKTEQPYLMFGLSLIVCLGSPATVSVTALAKMDSSIASS